MVLMRERWRENLERERMRGVCNHLVRERIRRVYVGERELERERIRGVYVGERELEREWDVFALEREEEKFLSARYLLRRESGREVSANEK